MKNLKKTNTQKPLIVFGYIIFSLLVIGVLFSTTIPFGTLLQDPHTMHYNIALFAIILTIGALLPAILGYIIGDHSVKSKSSTSHHFNGMLFGLLAFWLMLIFSSIISNLMPPLTVSSFIARGVLVNILPSIAVAIGLSVLAVSHVRNRQASHDMVEYKPYGILLIGSVLSMPIWSLISNLVTQNFDMSLLYPFIVICLLGAISYLTLRKSKISVFSKLTWSAVSISVAYMAIFVSSQFITSLSYYINNRPSAEFQVLVSSAGWMLALLGWIIFWYIQVKSLSKK